MNLRAWLKQHPSAGGVKAIVGLGGAAAILFFLNGRSPATSTEDWYYDTGTQQLFAVPQQEVPPVPAPSGQEGVKAHVFSCGACSERERYIGYLSTYTAEARAILQGPAAQAGPPRPGATAPPPTSGEARLQALQSQLIRSPEGGDWVPLQSDAGREIFRVAKGRCGEKSPQTCQPGQ